MHKPLVTSDIIFLPPLHIKLGLFKQFVKALDKESSAFAYLAERFPSLSQAKIKKGIFIGPKIRKNVLDETSSPISRENRSLHLSHSRKFAITSWVTIVKKTMGKL